MSFKKLRIEVINRVGYILLDAGSRFNKLSITTIRELKRAFTQVEEDVSANVIVLSGYPGESFAVGADIGQMVHFSPNDAFHFAELGQSLFDQIESCPKPAIGALNGIAMGAAVIWPCHATSALPPKGCESVIPGQSSASSPDSAEPTSCLASSARIMRVKFS